MIQQSKDPVRIRIYEEKINPPGQNARFYDRQTGVALLRNSSFAFFGEERKYDKKKLIEILLFLNHRNTLKFILKNV